MTNNQNYSVKLNRNKNQSIDDRKYSALAAISGWLVLPYLGFYASLIIGAISLLGLLFGKDSKAYSISKITLISVGLLGVVAFSTFSIILIHKRKPAFIRAAAILYLLIFLLSVNTAVRIGNPIICLLVAVSGIIWICYFKKSKRVSALLTMTFKRDYLPSEVLPNNNDTKMHESNLKEDRIDLRKAQNMAAWSYVGLVIPILGWILAGISLSLSKDLPQEGKLGERRKNARSNAIVSIILSIGVAIIWVAVSVNANNAAKQQQALQAAHTAQQQAVQDCINKAHQFFDPQIDLASNSYDHGATMKYFLDQRIASCQTNTN